MSRANTSEYVGASVLVGDVRPRLLLSDKSLRLVPKPGVRPDWLHEVLQSRGVRRQMSALATGTKDSMRNISQQALLSIEVPDTPESGQGAVVEECRRASDAARSLRADLNVAQRRAASLRQALLAAAFSGRLTDASSDTEAIEEAEAMLAAEGDGVVVGQREPEGALW